MPKLIDLTGRKFRRLEVIKYAGKDKWGHSFWLCRCDCKNEIIVPGCRLKNGETQSCGCLFKEGNNLKHGHSKIGKVTKIYSVWLEVKQRCTNPNHKQWKDYGGRRITVCDKWLHSFPNFKRDNPGWRPGLTLERRRNELGYFKGNCYWATWKQQQRNTRRNHLIPCFGKIQCIAAWSEETGIPQFTIRWRVNHGWTPEKTLTEPIRKRKKRKQ